MTTTYPTSRQASSMPIQPFPRPDFASKSKTVLTRYLKQNARHLKNVDTGLLFSHEGRCQLANLVFDLRAVEFEAFLKERQKLDAAMDAASAELARFPKGPMGLTPDAVKFSEPFQSALKAFNTAQAALRALNGQYVKLFKEELRHVSLQRRAANLKPI